MAKRTRSAGGGGGPAAGVNANEEESETCKNARQRRQCSTSSRDHLSRLDQDLVLEIAARLASPSDARSLALASAELYSVISPALSRVDFLITRYLRRGVPGAPQCPPGFFLSTSRKTCRRRRRRRREDPAPDTVFVRGPRNILRGYNVVDPATFRAFLATAKRRRAYVVASSGHLLLCAHGDGAVAGARYSVVNPATDLWISLPQPPGLEEAAAAYVGCSAFHCAAGMELTVAYLARRRHSGHLVVHWFTSTSGQWHSMPTAAHGSLRPAASAACVGGTFYWMLVHAGSFANAGRWLQGQSPCAVLAWNTNKSWKLACPKPLPQGLTMLREADGLLRYCHTARYPYHSHWHPQNLDGVNLDVWTLEAAAGDGSPAASVCKWQRRLLGDDDNAEAHADEGVDAEFWTWVLYSNIQAAATYGYRAEDVVAGHTYDVFRYSPDLTS